MLFLPIQTDAEYADMFLTYKRDAGQGNYTKLFNRAQYSLDLPESVDWRTNNAVTGIKDQVCLYHNVLPTIILINRKQHTHVQTHTYSLKRLEKLMCVVIIFCERVCVEPAMHSVPLVLWREPRPWLTESSLHSVNRTSLTVLVRKSLPILPTVESNNACLRLAI